MPGMFSGRSQSASAASEIPAASAARASGVRAPVLWVIGSADRPAMSDRAPYSTGTRIEVAANHQQTPVVAVDQIVDWIGRL